MRPRNGSRGSHDLRRKQRRNRVVVSLAGFSLVASACAWDPSHPFDHDVPEVNKAISALDAGDATVAAQTLEDYLKTGECNNGSLGIPDLVKKRPDGTFDLGLALFKIGESFGQRFGDEEEPDAGPPDAVEKRQASVNCALHVVEAIASGVPATSQEPGEAASIALRARAHYLAGNLHFLLGEYEDAVKEYDTALGLAPGEEDAGDPVGRDAAWNRAIALTRIEQKKKDGGPPDGGNGDGGKSSSDGGNDGGGNDAGNDGGSDGGGGKNDKNDAGKDGGGQQPDAGPPPPPQNQPDAGAPPPPPESANADDRILDQLERAPTVQQEAAKKAAARNRSGGMIDK